MRPEDLKTLKLVNDNVKAGSMKALVPGSNRVAIGSGLAQILGAYPGSEISLINPDGPSTAVGTVPRIVTYQVAAVFEAGVYQYDKAYILMPLEDAQALLMLGDSVGQVRLMVKDPEKVAQTLEPLVPATQGRGVITDWKQMNSELFEALEVERVAMFVVLSLIVLNAVFNILSSLIMLVRAKTRDIAILRTMGASRRSMMTIFMTVGTTIGALGTLLGALLGAIILFFRQPIIGAIQAATGQNLWDPSVRFLTELPARTDPVEVGVIIVTALILTFLATLYPAWKAASTDPVQVLRYE
jgi:lipoprotein-releasing system permease protein